MITAWSPPFGAPRFRLSAGSRRLLLVAMLLFGLMYAHGVSAEGVAGHVTSASTSASAAAGTHGSSGESETAVQGPHAVPAETAEHHDDEHDSSHATTQECVPGQPQQGPEMEAPCVSAWPVEAAVSDQSLGAPVRSESVVPPPGVRESTGSGVLRI